MDKKTTDKSDRSNVSFAKDKERSLYRFQWTWPVLISAIACIALIVMTLAAVIKAMKFNDNLYIMVIIGIMLLIMISVLYYLSGIPLSLRVHKDCLVVSKFVYNVSIPWEGVKSVDEISGKQLKDSISGNSAKRGFGFGYMGRRHSRELGYFYLYALSLHSLVAIETDERKYIISVPARGKLLEDIRQRMDEAL